MASTPMDLDGPESSPANGTPLTSLNITRTLGANLPKTAPVTDVIANFRPTKVPPRPPVNIKPRDPPKEQQGLRTSKKKHYITAASVLPHQPGESSRPRGSTEASLSAVSPSETADLALVTPKSLGDDLKNASISNNQQLFKRDELKEGRPKPYILSLDYDDPGELLMTSESDDTIQIYKVREGRHEKQLLSKKYGVKLAKFTHTSSSVVYASTKVNDAIRYLTTHDNAFIRYFEGHEAAVTSLAMHPGQDDFISCSKDNTVRLWNAATKNAVGVLNLNTPYLAAYDPSGQVFAIGSPSSGQILLYDQRNFDKAPFSTFDVAEACAFADTAYVLKGWTKLEFSNDGKNLLLGTKGNGHFLIDAFEGTLRAYLHKPNGGTRRLAAGEAPSMNGSSANGSSSIEGSGDCGFSPDGRYVVGGGANNKLLIWDTLGQVDEDKTLEPLHMIDSERPASVVAFSPRFNFIATADQEVVFWLPDPHA
ncbi:hypothetical protein PFICI_05345 [Pestalotiopsis fici W106-1]|uniref:Uncharacterized protein n=1 Tax=Pestalotiopsis fici (strain W106-1 / CGMCC3.15140) TaxID=1229662 RepID=W3XBR7_PESFW|nr:uncharacterized protein PFICI_05345 [Pestalotiopsis fici W106-1]ETS83469.1 hypothetical protein PFICI_05345 [Pestalotiopsis fici W106-1]